MTEQSLLDPLKVIDKHEFNALFDIETKRTKLVEHLVEVVANKKNSKNLASWTNTELIGSSRMKRYGNKTFYDVLRDKRVGEVRSILNATDYDFALKLDSFFLEKLSSTFPNFQRKENDEYGYGEERDLKVVYSLPVKDLVELFPLKVNEFFELDRKDPWSSTSGVPKKVTVTENFLSRRIEFLSFRDLEKTSYIWKHLPTPLFAHKFWKHSPDFIGREALKDVFKMLEVVADYKKLRPEVLSVGEAFANVPLAAPVALGVEGGF